MDPTTAEQAAQVVQVAQTVQPFALQLIVLGKALILPTMLFVFTTAIILRALIYYTVMREESFAIEFEKRANHYLRNGNHKGSQSYFVVCKRLLEKTYYEMFELRAIMKRRRLDHIMVPSDRVFLIQPGTAYLVKDCLKELQYIKYDGTKPPLLDIVKSIFSTNPCFTRVFGYLPVGAFNEMLNVIPGLFIVGGIFGTFLGIMQALPELGAMDIRDPESTKLVMDTFLAKIAFSMSSSTIGILLSVIMTVYNNFLSPERLFTKIVERMERNLYRIWSRCDNNRLPEEIPDFDENRDAIEALASMALDKEIASAENGVLRRRGADSESRQDDEKRSPESKVAPKSATEPERVVSASEEERQAA